MKKTLIIICYLFTVKTLYPQQRLDLKKYAADTLSLLMDLNFLGQADFEYPKDKFGLLNTLHSDTLYNFTGGRDSAYVFSIDNLPFKSEFLTDGNYANVFISGKTINKISNCSWIELKEIRLKNKSIYLKILLNKKTDSKLTETTLYEFKIIAPKHSSVIYNHYYEPKYRLKKKRTLISQKT